jgi:hypothetical protein
MLIGPNGQPLHSTPPPAQDPDKPVPLTGRVQRVMLVGGPGNGNEVDVDDSVSMYFHVPDATFYRRHTVQNQLRYEATGVVETTQRDVFVHESIYGNSQALMAFLGQIVMMLFIRAGNPVTLIPADDEPETPAAAGNERGSLVEDTRPPEWGDDSADEAGTTGGDQPEPDQEGHR